MSVKSFEETIVEVLDGDTQKNALDFAAFLKANGMTTGENHGTVMCEDKVIAYMHMDGKPEMPGPWTIWPDVNGTVPDGFEFDEAMKSVALNHVNFCGKCGSTCAPGSRKTIYGKEFDNVCGALLAFTDPTHDALVCVKRLLELIKFEA